MGDVPQIGRSAALLFSILLGTAVAGEQSAQPVYPLWDNHEPVEAYAKRVHLAPTRTIDLGNNVKMELVLIPAGKFVMGVAIPTAVDEEGLWKQIAMWQILGVVSAAILLVMFLAIPVRSIRHRRRPQVSLGRLTALTLLAGACLLSYLNWRGSTQTLKAKRSEYAFEMKRYHSAAIGEGHSFKERYEQPPHFVTLTQPFYMGKFVITEEQYQ